MTRILDLLRREPAALSSIVSALIALGVAFGLQLSTEQTGAIMAVVSLVSGLLVRGLVTPTSTVAAIDETGSDTPPAATAGPAAPGIPEGAPVEVVPDPAAVDVPQSSDTKADAATHDPRADE